MKTNNIKPIHWNNKRHPEYSVLLNYFDGISCDLFPFQIENTTALDELDKEENEVVVYPNPTREFVQLKLNDEAIYRAILYNSIGELVLSNHLRTNQQIDLSEFSDGIYLLVLHKDGGKQIRKKIIKH